MDTDLHARVAALPVPMVELLLRWTGADSERRSEMIRPRNRTLPTPLSFAQERLWFLDQLNPGNTAYNLPLLMRFAEPCESAVLQRALDDLASRHDSLRTTFALVAGSPVQRIAASAATALQVIDLRGHADAATEADRILREELARPFDLQRGPLLRTMLLRRSDSDALLIADMHHIISDGWSFGVFTRELNALYESHTQGRPPGLPELPIQYADFAAWQREWLRGENLAAHLAYWKDQLAAAPPLLELPTERPRPVIESNRGAFQTVTVPQPLADELRALARGEDATLFMTMLAGFAALLSRYGDIDDMVIGSPIANRNRQELEGLIGFFVNMLGLRVRVEDRLSMRALIGRVRETTLGGYEHQELPFEKLVAELHPQRSLSHSPVFQVAFVLQNTPDAGLGVMAAEAAYPGWNAEPLWAAGAAKCDLILSFGETGTGLIGTCEYRTDLYSHRSIHRLLYRYRQVLECMTCSPEVEIGELPLRLADEPFTDESFADEHFADEPSLAAATTGAVAQQLAEVLGLGGGSRLLAIDDGTVPEWLDLVAASCTGVGAELLVGTRSALPGEGVTHVISTPEALAAVGSDGLAGGVTVIVVGLPSFDVVWTRWGERRVVGLWGIPGAPICATLLLRGAEAAIAAPLPGHRFEILDRRHRRQPVDFWGELHIGLSSPAAGEDPVRLLHSGLRARRLDDGSIEVSGRIDAMQRIGGMSVDPERLDAVLRQHPALAAAQTRVHDEDGTAALYTFVVPRGQRRMKEDELIDYVAARLPAALIPKRIGIVQEMPGADATVARPRPMAEPKSAVEAVIARIWASVLKRPVMDAEANFFDLGGNSLSSVQIMSRIREVFRVELELHRLFDAPTVAELAAMVEKDPRLHLAEPDDADDERIEPALTRTFAMLGIEGVSMSHEDILDLVYTLDDWEVDELLQQLQPHAGQG